MLYGMAFLGTVLFYNYPYARNYRLGDSESNGAAGGSPNPRAQWYRRHRRFIQGNRTAFSVMLIVILAFFIIRHHASISSVPLSIGVLIVLFPLTALLYYGHNVAARHYSLRQLGWAKPFIIGFVWTGVVYVYPLLYARWIGGQALELQIFHLLQFLKSLMYISMLAILFDIKDYAADKHRRLDTLIVRIGIRRTLFGVILPLGLLGLLMFFAYAFVHEFSPWRILLTMIPFLLLLGSLFSFRKKRSLMFYLIVIDGLMLAKAFFGILATQI